MCDIVAIVAFDGSVSPETIGHSRLRR